MSRPTKNRHFTGKLRPKISFLAIWEASILVVLAAVLICTFLFQTAIYFVATSPHYQASLLRLSSNYIGRDIQVEETNLEWSSYGPSIHLQGITWQADNNNLALQAQDLQVHLDLLAPFSSNPLIHLVIAHGEVRAQAGNEPAALAFPPDLHLLGDLHNLSLSIAQVQGAVGIQHGRFRLRNGELTVQAAGAVHWHDHIDAAFQMAWGPRRGLYLDIQSIDLQPNWHTLIADLPLPQGTAEYAGYIDALHGQARIWLRPDTPKEGGQLSADVNIQHLGLNVTTPLTDLRFVARLDYQTHTDKRSGFIDNLHVEIANQTIRLPAIRLQQDADVYAVQAETADLAQLGHLGETIGQGTRVQDIITQLKPEGRIDNLEFRFNRNKDATERFVLGGWLANVSVQPAGPSPGGHGLSGYINITQSHGQFLLDSQESGIFIAKIYPRPLPFSKARGQFAWEFVPPDQLFMVGSVLDIHNAEQDASMELSVHSIFKQHGYLDLQVGLTNASMTQSKVYIPWLIFGDSMQNWLNRSLVDGSVRQAAMSLKMDTRQPAHAQNIFELMIEAEDIVFNYDDHQEPLVARATSMLLDRNHLTIRLPQGATATNSMQASSMQGQVNTETGILAMAGEGEMQGAFLASLMNQYVLAADDVVPEDPVKMEGRFDGHWGFVFDVPQRALNDLSFDAQFNLSMLHHPLLIPAPRNLKGQLSFAAAHGYRGKVSGDYDDLPFNGRFITRGDTNYLQLDLSLTPANYLPPPFAQHVQGRTPARINLYTDKNARRNFNRINVKSDLAGVRMNLPLAKAETRQIPTNLDIAWNDDDRIMRLAMHEALSAGLHTRAGTPIGWSIQMPAAKPEPIRAGLVATIRAPLNLTAWRDLLGTTDPQVLRPASWLETIQTLQTDYPYWDLQADALEFAGRTYRDLGVSYDDEDGLLAFSLGETNGRLTFLPHNINIHLNELHITKNNNDRPPPRLPDRLSFEAMPPIQLTIAKIVYEDETVGQATVDLAFTANNMTARMEKGRVLTMPAQGNFSWILLGPKQSRLQTSIAVDGDLPSGTVPNLAANGLSYFMQFAWQGANRQFDQWRQKAQGRIELRVEEGSIATTRANLITNLISFLNINRLASRLTGDFKDLSRNSMTFENLKADLELQDGNLTTTPELSADFSFGHLVLIGRYMLTTQQLDFRAIVTPAASQTLAPAALLLGAFAAIPALLALELTGGGKFFNRFVSVNYQISGNITDAEVQPISFGDLSGRELSPEELSSKADIRRRTQNLTP